jgi:hypothetical protein
MKNYWLNRKAEREKPQVCIWSFDTALGETIREKYESMYVKVIEVSNLISRKTISGGANWLVMHPEVASIFEPVFANFAPPINYDWKEGF